MKYVPGEGSSTNVNISAKCGSPRALMALTRTSCLMTEIHLRLSHFDE